MFKKLILLCALLQSAFMNCSHANPSTPLPTFPKVCLYILKNEQVIRHTLLTKKDLFYQQYKEAIQLMSNPGTLTAEEVSCLFDTALTNFDQALERFKLFEKLDASLKNLLTMYEIIVRDYNNELPVNHQNLALFHQFKQNFALHWNDFLHTFNIPQESMEFFSLE
jgi:hypothetical protein